MYLFKIIGNGIILFLKKENKNFLQIITLKMIRNVIKKKNFLVNRVKNKEMKHLTKDPIKLGMMTWQKGIG